MTASEHITDFIAMALEESIEQTLHIARSVSLYRIPPRGPTGHVSGDWRVSDRRERWPAAALHADMTFACQAACAHCCERLPLDVAVFEGRMRVVSIAERCEIR